MTPSLLDDVKEFLPLLLQLGAFVWFARGLDKTVSGLKEQFAEFASDFKTLVKKVDGHGEEIAFIKGTQGFRPPAA